MCGRCKREIIGVWLSGDSGVTWYHPQCAPAELRVAILRDLGVQVGTG